MTDTWWTFGAIGIAVAIFTIVGPYADRRTCLIRYCLGLDLPAPSKGSTDGSSLVANAFGFVILQAYTLSVVLEQKHSPQLIVFAGYGLTSLATTAAICGIMRATCLDESGSEIRRFDLGTQLGARWTWGWSMVIPVCFVGLALANALPTSEKLAFEPIPLSIRDVEEHTFEDGKNRDGLRFTVPITPSDFKGGVPERLPFIIRLDEGVNKQLRIVGASVYKGLSEVPTMLHSRPATFDPDPNTDEGKRAREFQIETRGLDPKSTYLLVVRVRRRSEDLSRKDAINLLYERKRDAIAVDALSPRASEKQ